MKWSRRGRDTGSSPNRTVDNISGCWVYHSYAVIIGFEDRDGRGYLSESCWSQTTAKHITELGELLGIDKDERYDRDKFLELYNQLVLGPQEDPKDHTPLFGEPDE